MVISERKISLYSLVLDAVSILFRPARDVEREKVDYKASAKEKKLPKEKPAAAATPLLSHEKTKKLENTFFRVCRKVFFSFANFLQLVLHVAGVIWPVGNNLELEREKIFLLTLCPQSRLQHGHAPHGPRHAHLLPAPLGQNHLAPSAHVPRQHRGSRALIANASSTRGRRRRTSSSSIVRSAWGVGAGAHKGTLILEWDKERLSS